MFQPVRIIRIMDIGRTDNAFADAGWIHAIAHRRDASDAIRPLNAGEPDVTSPIAHAAAFDAKTLLASGFGRAVPHAGTVPTGAGVDVGIVHPGGGHAHKRFAWPGLRHGNISAVAKSI